MRLSRLFWTGAIAALLVGCKSFFAPIGIPDDPLLIGRQPIESRGHPLPVITYREPVPPGEDAYTMPRTLPTAEELVEHPID
ncbi:MAG TPA: hypothetical protein VHR72_10010 [Gemmataceae bacterium]|jgi:hypothetical protein|nr:hypothetical protein [Gemmataceae bacterium]